MNKKQKNGKKNIEPGMVVEATGGDLGEEDVSKPKVTGVVQDQQGKVEKLIVQKGVIFKKSLEIPADRIHSVEPEDIEDESKPGKVIVVVSEKEAEALTSVGVEALAPEQQHDLLDSVEKEIPTAEGLREMEASSKSTQAKQTSVQSVDAGTAVPQEARLQHAGAGDEDSRTLPGKKSNFLLRVLGPGFLGGATISPYNMFWQVQGEKEEQRAGSTRQKMRGAALDIAIGVISGNLAAYFIIISTTTTLYAHHQNITTAADAA
jgi:Natural resistance-associated macrophage protein